MRFRMLGPLQVRSDDVWVPVAAPQQRVVLAVLLIEAGRMVSTEKLVDAVWPDRPPRTAINTIAAYVLRLRRLVGAETLATLGRGYQLTLDDADLDALVFEQLIDAARRDVEQGRFDAGATHFARALALWPGTEPALADVPPRPLLSARVTYLDQLRFAAAEENAAVLLELGRHTAVVDELHRLVREQPLRELRWALLMKALDRDGRRGEALAAYQQARQVLHNELGLEPGPQLRQLQQAILTSTLPPVKPAQPAKPARPQLPAKPAQLPPDTVGFTGREKQLSQLDGALRRSLEEGGPAGAPVMIAALAGPAGVGKTALAVHWSHRTAEHFPDGQLYVNLRGYAATPAIRPTEGLARFLRALGVPAEQIPSDVDEAAALYRSLLAGKRVLVLLDNASSPDQVRPLLPAGPGCATLVTSRDRLAGLIARDGATSTTVDVLTCAEAHSLLATMLGSECLDAEPEAARELTRLCGNLPLALRIASANLATRVHTSIAGYVTRLAGNRLDDLEVDGDPHTGVRAAFDLSYSALSEPAQYLFRCLGLLPGPDATAATAAALTDSDPASAGRLLDQLSAAHLVEEHLSGRYTMQDLMRTYAAEKARTQESPARRQAVLERLFDHYLRHVAGAAEVLYPEMLRLPHTGTQPARFDDKSHASRWIDEERSNLVASVVYAAANGPRQVAWRLADGMRGYFLRRMLTVEWDKTAKAGIAAAQEGGDAFALTASFLNLAGLHATAGRRNDAIRGYTRTIAFAQDAGWTEAEIAAVANIGAAYLSQGQFAIAAGHFSRSLAMRRRIGWPLGEATDLDNLGLAHWGMGQLELAATHHAQAAEIYRGLGASLAAARANGTLGVAYHGLGRFAEAKVLLTQALAVLREAGDRYSLGHAHYCLADVHRDLGSHAEALDLAEHAIAAACETGDYALESSALNSLASIHHHLGDYARAVDGHRLALDRACQANDRFREVEARVRLAGSCHSAAQPDVAANLADQVLDLARSRGYALLEGQALTTLAASLLAADKVDTAVELAGQALRVHARTGHRLGLACTHLLAGHAWRRFGNDLEEQTHLAAADTLFHQLGADASTHARMLVMVNDFD